MIRCFDEFVYFLAVESDVQEVGFEVGEREVGGDGCHDAGMELWCGTR